jgi:hypothetical protein
MNNLFYSERDLITSGNPGLKNALKNGFENPFEKN